MVLFREALGEALREMRLGRNLNLRDVSQKAPMALGYLSEVERGQKEISSEFLVGLAYALDVEVSDILFEAMWKLKEREGSSIPAELASV